MQYEYETTKSKIKRKKRSQVLNQSEQYTLKEN